MYPYFADELVSLKQLVPTKFNSCTSTTVYSISYQWACNLAKIKLLRDLDPFAQVGYYLGYDGYPLNKSELGLLILKELAKDEDNFELISALELFEFLPQDIVTSILIRSIQSNFFAKLALKDDELKSRIFDALNSNINLLNTDFFNTDHLGLDLATMKIQFLLNFLEKQGNDIDFYSSNEKKGTNEGERLNEMQGNVNSKTINLEHKGVVILAALLKDDLRLFKSIQEKASHIDKQRFEHIRKVTRSYSPFWGSKLLSMDNASHSKNEDNYNNIIEDESNLPESPKGSIKITEYRGRFSYEKEEKEEIEEKTNCSCIVS